MVNRILSICLTLLIVAPISAQDLGTLMGATDYHLKSDETRSLYFALDNLSFYKNNEFDGEQSHGYTLPGLWVQPKLTYQPLDNVKLEAGLHALIFDGANKYPCYVYHDIGRWKGDQYQSGAHLLPFFRVQAQLGNVTFVLGDIYGGANHATIEPLMNPEVNLSQDPEMGFQLLVDLPRWQLDAWINWQSYIFKEDTHQEAFTVGINQRFQLNDSQSPVHWYVPLDILINHRGGEQDTAGMGRQSVSNAGAGLGVEWNAQRGFLRRLNAEADLLGCWQINGDLWPFRGGVAGSLSASADFAGGFRAFCSIFATKDFVSLYGAPFYSTMSQRQEGARFAHMITPHVGVEWHHTFAQGYTLGAKIDAYPVAAGRLTYADGVEAAAAFSNNFSFGIFMRCNPRFLLKVFK